jgi:hypothetical protein
VPFDYLLRAAPEAIAYYPHTAHASTTWSSAG